jgi:hypothetical protein
VLGGDSYGLEEAYDVGKGFGGDMFVGIKRDRL